MDLPGSKRDETALSRGETERGSIDSQDYAMWASRTTTIHLEPGERFSTHVQTHGSNQASIKDPTFRLMVHEIEIWTDDLPGQPEENAVVLIGKRVRTNGSLTMHNARGKAELDKLPPSLVARIEQLSGGVR